MGRRNKSYSKDLHQQAYERLNGMQAFGESRRAAKVEGTDRDKIFSFNTYKSYWKHTKYFIKYIKEHHPECTTLKKARKYVGEWLQDSVDRGLSAWTIGVQRSAMGKLYGIAPDDEDFFKAPKKQRENIKRSRGVRVRKGGRERISPIIGPNMEQIVERIRNTPAEEKVWQHVHQSADIHGYRAEYATAIYKSHARPIAEIPYDRVNKGTGHRYQSQVYTCRKDESGRKLDKAAMLVCSKALGHNRLEVVANNYIRDL